VTILSLLLCLATVAMWVRSYWRFDQFYRDVRALTTGHVFTVQSGVGRIAIRSLYLHAPYNREGTKWDFSTNSEPGRSLVTQPNASFLGFGFYSVNNRKMPASNITLDTGRFVWFPHWFLALLFAILPAIRLRSILRTRRRHRVGLCPHCGYDLRATLARCPECGAAARRGRRHGEEATRGRA
jgi:hypothetical protein